MTKEKIDYDNYETSEDLNKKYEKTFNYEPSDDGSKKRLEAMFGDD